ncbi:MAG: hypothetical protein JXR76_09080 [Deltaproteobacteria bacterium]|nr:hypothetical protein [Deltaproteobacteria bacterium]
MKGRLLIICFSLLICVTACEKDKTNRVEDETVTTTDSNVGRDSFKDTDSNADSDSSADSGSVFDSDSDGVADSDSHRGAAMDSESDPDTNSQEDPGTDSISDTISDSDSVESKDSGSDTGADTAEIAIFTPGTACTQKTAASDCGLDLICVDGVCCNELCAGACASCTIPGFEGHCLTLNQGTVCRPEATPCDAAELCDGLSQECPLDEGKPLGASCGAQLSSACNAPDTCDLDGICQPNFATAGTPCGTDGGACKVSPMCNGAGACTSAVNKPDGTPCGNTTTTECDMPDSCLNGECSPNFAVLGTPCGDIEDVSECNRADQCDGRGSCSANLVSAGVPCGDTDESVCDLADQCDGKGNCDSRTLPDQTACGDDFVGECDKPDSCQGGVCVSNHVPDGAACNEKSWEIAYRCSDTDCSATPQKQVQSWSCRTGVCDTDPAMWENLGDGYNCRNTEICQSDGETFAECEPCEQEPFDECVGQSAISHYGSGFCTTAISGVPECYFEFTEEECAKNTDGQTNCAKGACTEFTCEPGEKDAIYTFDTQFDAEGWTLNKWHSDLNWPWSMTMASRFLRMDFAYAPESDCYYYPPATACHYYDFANDDESDAALISPPMSLYACTTGTVSFYFTMQDESDNCPATTFALECGVEGDWITLWSRDDINKDVAPNGNYQASKISDIDISPCLGREEPVFFRFIPHNLCNLSIRFLMIDKFSITAKQEVHYPNTDEDSANDTVM